MTVVAQRELTWQERIEKADAYLSVGQVEHYLSSYPFVFEAFPWQFVTSIRPGGSHRLEIDTDVYFNASHPSGLRFRWSMETETRDANGKGHYSIAAENIARALSLIGEGARVEYRAYLKRVAVALEANAAKFLEVAESEYGSAAVLRNLFAAQPQKASKDKQEGGV